MGLKLRQRWGVIMLGCIVGASLGIVPLVEKAGCTRRGDNHPDGHNMGSLNGVPGADSVAYAGSEDEVWKNIHREERSDTHRRSDSIKKAQKDSIRSARGKGSKASGGESRKEVSGGKKGSKREKENSGNKKSRSTERRSLRDDNIGK